MFIIIIWAEILDMTAAEVHVNNIAGMLWTDRLIVIITDKLKIQRQCLLQKPNSSTIYTILGSKSR